MSRVANWRPTAFDAEFAAITHDMILEGAHVVANNVKATCPVGTVSRPIYQSGPYAGQPWTARDAGQLSRSIRVVEKHGTSKDQFGSVIVQKGNVRVYVGHYLAYYARIVEKMPGRNKGFMRKAMTASIPALKGLLGSFRKAA